MVQHRRPRQIYNQHSLAGHQSMAGKIGVPKIFRRGFSSHGTDDRRVRKDFSVTGDTPFFGASPRWKPPESAMSVQEIPYFSCSGS